jgi:hypothetical protein
MPAQLTISDIQRRGNRLYVRFTDGSEVEGTRRELREHCRSILEDSASLELLKAIAISKGLRASADADDADDLDSLIGKTFFFNPRAATNICRVI